MMDQFERTKSIIFKKLNDNKYSSRKLLLIFLIYYVIILPVIIFLPYTTAFIPLLFIPVLHISLLSDIGYSFLANLFFLLILYSYIVYRQDFKISYDTILHLATGTGFSFIFLYFNYRFNLKYKKNQMELTKSMEQLAVSYRNLEITQTKLVALTSITKQLLQVQNREILISRMIELINRNLFYKHVVYLKRVTNGNLHLADRIGFYTAEDQRLLGKAKTYLENYDPQLGVQILSETELDLDNEHNGNEILLAPVQNEEKIYGFLVILYRDEWGQEEDRDIMVILVDLLALIYNNLELIENTQMLAITDGCTNLFNQRFFYQKLKDLFQIALEKGYPLSVVIFDLDDFKLFNDRYGHLFGDRVLEEIALMMSNNIRDNDILARYGGDEFALILPMTGQDVAYKIARRLVNMVANYEFKTEQGDSVRASISGGIATFPVCEVDDPIELVEMADKALYQSKDGGKNKVISGNVY